MDVRFWGPSGWQMLHTITFEKGKIPEKKRLLEAMVHILPCKYCRQSAEQFIKEMPVDDNIALWLYKFHDRVNQKLHNQHKEDPSVPEPIPSPPFSEVVKKYKSILQTKSTNILGTNFLLSIANNFKHSRKEYHVKFWRELVEIYPTLKMPNFTSRGSYVLSVYSMLKDVMPMPPLKTIQAELLKFKSKCKAKKTCRKRGGKRITKRLLRT